MKSIPALAILLLACSLIASPGQQTEEVEAEKPKKTESSVTHVDAAKAAELWKTEKEAKDFAVLDVRRLPEYEEGHVPNALLIDVLSDDFESKAKKLDKDKTYLVHCRSGSRSKTAVEKLRALGFENLVHLDGGFNAWKEAGNPVETGAPKKSD